MSPRPGQTSPREGTAVTADHSVADDILGIITLDKGEMLLFLGFFFVSMWIDILSALHYFLEM